LGWQIVHETDASTPQQLTETFVREISAARNIQIGAVVRNGADVVAVPAGDVIRSIPAWSTPNFRGMVKTKVEDKDRHYLVAHVAVENGARRTEVLLYQDAPPEFFQNLFSRLATISLDQGKTSAAGLDIKTTDDDSAKGVSF